jgi:hypothetical protein
VDDPRSAIPSSETPNSGQDNPALPVPRSLGPSVPASRDDQRDALFIKLLFASFRLADQNLRRYGFGRVMCSECGRIADTKEEIEHAAVCHVGAVSQVLAALLKLYEEGVEQGALAPAPAGEFGEPWRVDPADASILRRRDGVTTHDSWGTEVVDDEQELYAARIATCVNACAGLATEALLRGTRKPAANDLHGVDALFGCKAPEVKPFEYPQAEGGAQ